MPITAPLVDIAQALARAGCPGNRCDRYRLYEEWARDFQRRLRGPHRGRPQARAHLPARRDGLQRMRRAAAYGFDVRCEDFTRDCAARRGGWLPAFADPAKNPVLGAFRAARCGTGSSPSPRAVGALRAHRRSHAAAVRPPPLPMPTQSTATVVMRGWQATRYFEIAEARDRAMRPGTSPAAPLAFHQRAEGREVGHADHRIHVGPPPHELHHRFAALRHRRSAAWPKLMTRPSGRPSSRIASA